MHKEIKNWQPILLLGLICLNCAVILQAGCYFFQYSNQLKNSFKIGPINNLKQDPLNDYSFPHSSESSSNSTLLENNTALIYGFFLSTPKNRTIFNTLPNLVFNIHNATFIAEHTYQARIFNHSTLESANLSWFSCNPIDPESQQYVLTKFEFIWTNTIPEMAIYIDFNINVETSPYSLIFYKDLAPPQFTISQRKNIIDSYIPYAGSIEYYRIAPYIRMEITDNIPNIMIAHLLINNQLYSYNVSDVAIKSLKFEIIIPNWNAIPEGLNQIMLFMEDNAENISPFQIFAFNKDTTSPLSSVELDDLACLKIGNRLISDYRNPIYQIYEIPEQPIFYISVSHDDVSNVTLQIDITNIPIDEGMLENFDKPESSGDQTVMGINAINIYRIDESQHIIEFAAERVEAKLWKVEIPEWLWAKMGSQRVQMSIIVEDFAGNQANIKIDIERSDITSPAVSRILVRFYIILTVAIVSLAIFVTVMVICRPSKYKPLEKRLAQVDEDLLDVAIPCGNQMILHQFSEFMNHFGKKVDLECITPPEFQNLLTKTLQCINPEEITFLLSAFKMDPSEQEEFIHEMLLLSPEERAEFIIKYMEISSSNCPEDSENSFISNENEDDMKV